MQRRGKKRKVASKEPATAVRLPAATTTTTGTSSSRRKAKISVVKPEIRPQQRFPVFKTENKPLSSVHGNRRYGKKLMASVAPRIQQTPVQIAPKTLSITATTSNLSHGNPILLLPVSLQTGSGGQPNVASLPVLTLDSSNSAQLLNCLRLNTDDKTVTCTPTKLKLSDAWSTSSVLQGTSSTGISLKPANFSPRVLVSRAPTPAHYSLSTANDGQTEPLNLKMGETTVSSSTVGTTYVDTVQSNSYLVTKSSAGRRILPTNKKLSMLLQGKKKTPVSVVHPLLHRPGSNRSSPGKFVIHLYFNYLYHQV